MQGPVVRDSELVRRWYMLRAKGGLYVEYICSVDKTNVPR